MRLLSPFEDFSQRTLFHVEGALERLCYVACLRDQRGRYRHWGLARSYGEEAAHDLAQTAHKQVFLSVLEMPVEDLVQEYRRMQDAPGKFGVLNPELLPRQISPASRLHFSSVLFALKALAEAERPAMSIPQGA